jgi:hypothetical protein
MWRPLGFGATSCPAEGLGASYQRPRTVQSEETEIPRLSEERKLKTKCFFLKSRKEAASVEFSGG